MAIRLSQISDLDGINALLYQVAMVHHNGRPDLFRAGCKKYTDEELCILIEQEQDTRPIFVYEEDGVVLGYAFCMLLDYSEEHVLTPIKSLYIDDLCVDENCRGKHIGTKLFDFVKDYAREIGCYNVTLNVWACNPGALKFYEKCGMQVQKMGMEWVL